MKRALSIDDPLPSIRLLVDLESDDLPEVVTKRPRLDIIVLRDERAQSGEPIVPHLHHHDRPTPYKEEEQGDPREQDDAMDEEPEAPPEDEFYTSSSEETIAPDVIPSMFLVKRDLVRAIRRRYPSTEDCNVVNRHPLDANWSFEEVNHLYSFRGQPCLKSDGWYSATSLHEFFWKPFNKEYWSKRCAATKDHTSAYFGKTADEIKTIWDGAALLGTQRHRAYEAFIRHPQAKPQRIIPKGFYRALYDHPHLIPYRAEWVVGDEDLKLIGSIDIVFFHVKEKMLIIGDWKNCRHDELGPLPNTKDTGLHPLTYQRPHSRLAQYQDQLDRYALILQKYPLPYPLANYMLLFNFNPLGEDCNYHMERLVMTDPQLLRPYYPFNAFSAIHAAFPLLAPRCRVPPLPYDQVVEGPTRRARIPTGMYLPPNSVWVGVEVRSHNYPPAPRSAFAHPWNFFEIKTSAIAGYYEHMLLGNEALLSQVHTLYGKLCLCWCPDRSPTTSRNRNVETTDSTTTTTDCEEDLCRCHCKVLVKYANYSQGKPLWTLDRF
jgi:hypothetical protein